MFKQYQIVVFNEPPKGYQYPFKTGQCFIFLGEIVQMPGHCIVADRKGKIHWGFHTDNFRDPTEDEI